MANYFMSGAASPPWRLHVSEDPDGLRDRLREAFAEGSVVEFQAVAQDQLDPTTVSVNPRALGVWAVVETDD